MHRAAISLVLFFGCASCAAQKEFVVNTTEDLHDLNPGDAVCAGNRSAAACSLRAAIEEANKTNAPMRVRIVVPVGVYELSLGDLKFDDRGSITVRGAGQSQTIVDALQMSRILGIQAQEAREIEFQNMTMRNGKVGDTERGGAVLIDSPNYMVTFSSVTIVDSVAGFRGGGIYARGSGVLNVVNSIIEANSSTVLGRACDLTGGGQSGGGGIYAQDSAVSIVQSEIRNNCGSNGGGIMLIGGSHHLILRSTVDGNRGPTSGAGVFMQQTSGRIEDSTIVQNVMTSMEAFKPGTAGGLFVSNTDLVIRSSTIVENENPFEGDLGAGGLVVDGGSVTMRNTVLADNHQFGKECVGSITSEGGNFIGETNDDCDISAQASDILDVGDPGLGPLTFNGGLTRTMMPSSSSPLVNAGISGCEEIDQRGLAYPAPRGGACDIGAVERSP